MFDINPDTHRFYLSDAELGLADVAGNLYFPGWQQPATPLEILMTGRTWGWLRRGCCMGVLCRSRVTD
jgi:hypothetical protein